MDIHTLLVMGHVIGTILGVGGATIAEVQVNVALKDRRIDPAERALMHANYWMIRAGLAMVILSGAALIAYLYQTGSTWALSSHKLWIKELMVAVIILNAVALSRRFVPLWLGAAVSLTSWWGAALLGMIGRLPFSFLEYLAGYAATILAVAGILHIIRSKVTR